MNPLATPDGRYLIVRGRLWRATNPALPVEVRAALVSDLMDKRQSTHIRGFKHMISDLADSQSDMRSGYCSGGAGVLASAIVWAVASVTAFVASPQQSVWALFIGGMLIHPAGVLMCKLLGSSGNHSKGNPLGSLAWASTLWLIFSLPLAYAVSLQRMEWFFPSMLLVIGGRYLVFSSLFGMRLYWLLGLVLAGSGFLLGQAMAPPAVSALAGAAIEASFAAAALVMHRRWVRSGKSFKPKPLRGLG